MVAWLNRAPAELRQSRHTLAYRAAICPAEACSHGPAPNWHAAGRRPRRPAVSVNIAKDCTQGWSSRIDVKIEIYMWTRTDHPVWCAHTRN
jgi:hypothetical protein